MKVRLLKSLFVSSGTILLALTAVLPARADYSNTVMSFNPVMYYRLNETAPVPIADEAVNSGSAGAVVNGWYTGTAGVNVSHPTTPGAMAGSTDGAVTFSGNPPGGVAALGYLLVPYSPILNPPAFTAEAWLNPADLDGTLAGPTHCAFSCGDFAAPRAGWLVYQSGEGWNLRMYNRNGTATSLSISGGGAPVAGAWYHVVVVFDGTTARLYINGAQVASGNPSSYVPGSAGGMSVGVRSDNAYPWNGVADEVAFYTNALSAGVIAAHYGAATTNGLGYPAQILADNPVAYYRLNEPFYSVPDPSALPVATNSGSYVSGANGAYGAGMVDGLAGVPYSGFEVNNRAPRFNAIAGSISIPGQASLNTSTLTIAGWLKREGNQSLGALLFQRDASMAISTGLQIWDSTGNNELRANWNDGEWGISTGLTPPDGVWTFVAMVVTPTDTVLYMDDRSVSIATLSGGPLTHSAHDFSIGSILIGQDPCCGARIFKGEIDEVAVFDTALTPAQIHQLYYAGNVPPVILTQPRGPAGTIIAGAPVTLSVLATGNPTLAYQWTKEGTNMPNRTTSALAFSNISTNDAGNYAVVVTNAYGAVTSSVVALSVTYPASPAALTNAVGYPAYNPATQAATLTQVILEFTGPLGAEGSNPSHYGIPGLTVSGAQFTNLNQTVILTTSPQTQGAVYNLTVTGVTDGVGQPLANNTAPFRAWVASPLNGVRFEYYPCEATVNPTFANVDVGALTSNSLFPDYPVLATNLWACDSRIIFPDDTHENYGARMRGVFVPPSSGNWRFYLRSDDASQVFFNPNGPDAAGRQLILNETGCCGDWNKYASPTFPLVAGQSYYLEMLYKEGGGGDYGKVAALLEPVSGVTNYPPLGTLNTAIDPASLAGPAIGYPYAPADVGGALTLVGPTSVTVQANHTASFSVAVSNPGDWPISYQWRRNGSPIPDATGSSYTLVPASAADNASFTVQVSKLGSAVVSGTATLTVTAATSPPAVAAVQGSTALNTLIVGFNELLSGPATGSFSVPGFTTMSAVLDSTGTNVILTFDPPLLPGQAYTLSVLNVQDSSGNTLASATVPVRTFFFSRGLLKFDYFGGLSQSDVTVFNLTSDPRYPNHPDWTAFIPGFNSRLIFPDDSHTGYGDHITGFFVPPTNGNYIFYIKSDDASQFYFNPNGSDAAGSTFQMEETGCCHGFSANPTLQPLALTNGQLYYMESIHKEGGGGDYVQVATKLESDSTPADALSPIAGNLLGILADPVGASVTITQQPANVLAVYRGADAPQAVFSENFNTANGGLTMNIFGTPTIAFSPWAWDSARGTWSCSGSNSCFGPIGTGLTLPAITMAKSGGVVLTFAHRYSFEGFNASDGTAWDGGQVRLSVNGGPFATVPAANFSTNGYLAPIGGTINAALTTTPGWINAAFVGESTNYASEAYLTSVASLGFFNAGDILRIQFATSWDDCSEGTEPNWEIDSMQVTVGAAVPVAVLLTVGAESTYQNLPNPYQAYIWQRDAGSGFTDIVGANSPTCPLNMWPADSGERFRCIVYGPGASATSAVATVTVTVPLAVARTAPNSLRLSWPLPPPPLTTTSFLLEKSATLLPGSWSTVPTGTYQPTSTQVFVPVTIAPADPPTFYRLRRN